MVSPAFGYAGVGFPIAGMLAFAKGWGAILPLRWYMQILFDQAARGAPSPIPPGLSSSSPAWPSLRRPAWWRLAALARRKGEPVDEESGPAVPSPGAT